MRRTETEIVAEIAELSTRRLRLWVRRGWVKPAEGESGPLFDDLDAARLRLVCDLKTGMGVNDDAVDVVLSLLDQLHGVRRELRTLARAVDRQPREVRARIVECWRGAGED